MKKIMSSKAARIVAMLFALLTGIDAHAAQVRAWLDRNSMQLGETVTLNVEVSDNAGAAQPDFNALQQDFTLLGTQSSTSMNIVNGAASSKLLWAVGLEPKRAGTLTVPALAVAGAQTQPLTLTVSPASSTSGKAGDDLFLDLEVEPKSPYVQQQVRVTVKLFFALNLTDGNLEDPHGDGINARKLGQDASYTADVEGRRYRVLERHYALTVEKSGAAAIEPILFRGHAVNPNDVNSFFTRGRSVTARVPGATLQVRPRPANSGSDAWLPAQSLTLSADGIDASTQARVGEPLTLTLHLKAQGLGFEQLPELKLPKIEGADVYPDKETTVNRDDGAWQYGERTRKFAIVPNRAGTLTLPALSLAWWDVAHDRAASADVTAQAVNVAVAAGTAASVASPATNSTNIQSVAPTTAPVSPKAEPGSGAGTPWRILALVAVGLWLLTVVAWSASVVARRRQAADAGPVPTSDIRVGANASTARSAFIGACKRGDAPAIARALIAWARAEGSDARTLGELAHTLDASQRAASIELERYLYAANAETCDGARVATAFRDGLAFIVTPAGKAQSPLPPLYPFATKRSDESVQTLH